MKAKYICFSLLLMCSFFSGCKSVPEDVSNRMVEYGDNKQMPADDITYCTVEELRKSGVDDVNVKLDNMILPDSVDFSAVDDISTLELAFEEHALEKEDYFLEKFGIERDALSSEDVLSDGKKVVPCRVYDMVDTRKYFAMDDRGWLVYSSDEAYDILNGELEKITEEHYDMYFDDISGRKVTIGGEEVSLENIYKDAEKKLEEYRLTEEYDYHITDMYISKLKGTENNKDGCMVSLVAEAYYKGIAFNDYGNDSEFDGEKVNMSLFTYNIKMDYAGEQLLESYNNGWGNLVLNNSNKVDKVIDFNSAVRIVNSEISGFNQLEIYKIIPLYALYPEVIQDPDIDEFPWTGQKVSARPVYAFIMKADKKGANKSSDDKSNDYKYIFVDMIDGTISTDIS